MVVFPNYTSPEDAIAAALAGVNTPVLTTADRAPRVPDGVAATIPIGDPCIEIFPQSSLRVMRMVDRSVVRLAARAQSVAEARAFVDQELGCWGVSDAVAADVRLAVSEAVSNVVVHAYRDRTESDGVTVEIGRGQFESIQLVVTDEGVGPEPNPESEGLGLGLHLMAAVSESLRVEGSPGRGMRVEMAFPIV